jgi:hypothetical protein
MVAQFIACADLSLFLLHITVFVKGFLLKIEQFNEMQT